MAFQGPEVRSGARMIVQITKVQTGKRKRTRKQPLQRCSYLPFASTAAERIPNSCIWISMLHLVPEWKLVTPVNYAKPQNDTDNL